MMPIDIGVYQCAVHQNSAICISCDSGDPAHHRCFWNKLPIQGAVWLQSRQPAPWHAVDVGERACNEKISIWPWDYILDVHSKRGPLEDRSEGWDDAAWPLVERGCVRSMSQDHEDHSKCSQEPAQHGFFLPANLPNVLAKSRRGRDRTKKI